MTDEAISNEDDAMNDAMQSSERLAKPDWLIISLGIVAVVVIVLIIALMSFLISKGAA